MIQTQTVLVLGAGASQHLRFPLGGELKISIQSHLARPEIDTFQILKRLNFEQDHILGFQNALSYSGQPSVDAFLEHRPEFTVVGKTAIAQQLIQTEQDDYLFSHAGWYEYLLNTLAPTPEGFGENKLAVLTFNYDRSLEHYLFTALKNRFALSDRDTTKAMASIPIFHLHGSLAPLPWQSSPGVRPYNDRTDLESIRLARDSIRIIHEDAGDDQVFQRAHQLIAQAARLIFLGFGYHRDNVRRLMLPTTPAKARLYGSCFGFTKLETEDIKKLFPKGIVLGYYMYDVLDFLRNEIRLVE